MLQVAADWAPERVSAVTGIDEDRIRRLARELAGTERSVAYGRIGLCNQEFGSLASWLVDVINILTGHFDTPGGAMFPKPAAWSITTQPLPGLEGGLPEFGRWHTRVRGAKEVLGQAPVSCMAEEIATPGDGQLKALITVAGRPMAPQLPDILGTVDKKIRLAPQYLLDDLPRLAARMERPAEPLVLVSRGQLRSNNTWMHNVPALLEGQGPVHPAHPPPRRGPLRHRRRPRRHREIGGRRDQSAGRGHRCNQARFRPARTG
jgi:hypothetical protein